MTSYASFGFFLLKFALSVLKYVERRSTERDIYRAITIKRLENTLKWQERREDILEYFNSVATDELLYDPTDPNLRD